jgi:hypothetical protein
MSCAPSTRRGTPGPYSKPVTSDGIDRAAPAAPVNLHVTPGRARVLLTWNAPEHPTLDELINDAYFTVLRSEGTRLGADAVRVRCAEESGTFNPSRKEYSFVCYNESWELDTTYTYGVVFTDWQGNESAPSPTVTVTTADRVAPRPVTGLTATPRADGMLLRWNASTEDDIASYRALRGVRQADGSVKFLGTCVLGQDDPTAALCINVPDGESYVYAVYAVDKWDNATAVGRGPAGAVTAPRSAHPPKPNSPSPPSRTDAHHRRLGFRSLRRPTCRNPAPSRRRSTVRPSGAGPSCVMAKRPAGTSRCPAGASGSAGSHEVTTAESSHRSRPCFRRGVGRHRDGGGAVPRSGGLVQ